MRGLALIGFLLLTLSGAAQSRLDSLKREARKELNMAKRVDVLNDIAFGYYHSKPDSGFKYAQQALTLSEKSGYAKGKTFSLSLVAFYYYSRGDYDRSISVYKQATKVQTKDADVLGYAHIMLGNAYKTLSYNDSALLYLNKAVTILNTEATQRNLGFAYKSLGRLYIALWKREEAELNLHKALEIYNKQKSKYHIADTYLALSEVSKYQGDYQESDRYVQNACSLANEIQDEFLKLQCFIKQGDIKYRVGEYNNALPLYFEALKLVESQNVPAQIASLYLGIGNVYQALGQFDISMKYFLEGLKITERINLKPETASLLARIAMVHRNERNFKLAHEYIDRALSIRKEIKDDRGIANVYNVTGLILYREKKYSEAIRYLEMSLEESRKINHQEGMATAYANLAIVYGFTNRLEKALSYQLDALKLEEKIGNKYDLSISYHVIGDIYTKQKDLKKAEVYLRKAEAFANETSSLTLKMNTHEYWTRFFKAKGDFKKALEHHEKLLELKDSSFSDMSVQKLAEMQALYQLEKKEQEITVLNQSNLINQNEISLQRARINQQKTIIISVIVGLVLVLLLTLKTYQYNRRIRKANKEITEQKEEIQAQSEELIDANQTIAEINKQLESKIEARTRELSQAYKELDTFFYRSSHDFRRPLTTFLGLAEVAKITVKDANALELFDRVRDTAVNLDKMLEKLQSISDVGSHQLAYREVYIKNIFESVIDSFRAELQRKGIDIEYDIDLKDAFISYPALVKIIVENLVENAVDFSGVENPFIRLKAYQNGEHVTLEIQDNGQGIPPDFMERVFEMYFRGSERSKGNGLGLYITKKAVEKLNGAITVSSVHTRGTTFHVFLPRYLHNNS